MTKGEQNKLIEKYILDCIDTESHNVTTTTEKEKLKFILDTFNSEYGHNLKNYGNSVERTFENWLTGLPSCFNIDFENHRILELGREFHYLTAKSTDHAENIFLAGWWTRITIITKRMMKQNGIPLQICNEKDKA